MLVDFSNYIATVHCDKCGNINNFDFSNKISQYLEEFGEYENLPMPCVNCEQIEIFNMNLEIDEKIDDLEIIEEIQRGYVKDLIRTLRADFREGGTL